MIILFIGLGIGVVIFVLFLIKTMFLAIADKITDVIEHFYPVSIPPVKESRDDEYMERLCRQFGEYKD